MTITIHCVRHAQGYHNLCEENMHKYRDPSLTPRGKAQCERLRDRFPHHDSIDVVLASPIRRTIQTALIGFSPVIEKKDLKIILVPRAQETTARPADTGTELRKLHEEFEGRLDDRRMEDDWNSNEGEWKMEVESIENHVVELRRAIHRRAKELGLKNAVLVAHGGFLHYFTEDWTDCPGEEGETGWENTEFRSYEFIKGNGSHLKETKESKERRKDGATGGFDPENGAADENPELTRK